MYLKPNEGSDDMVFLSVSPTVSQSKTIITNWVKKISRNCKL